MKINKLSLFGYLLGGFIILSSTIRWFFLYNDYSNAVLGSAIGILVCFSAWCIDNFRKIWENINSLHRQADTIGAYVTGNIQEANLEEMNKP